MKRFLLLCYLSLALGGLMQAQQARTYRPFPLIATLNFQSISVPFRDAQVGLGNIGFSLGTEFRYHPDQPFVQQVQVGWQRNQTSGNAWQISTQAVWRPNFWEDRLFGEMRLGVSYVQAFRPTESVIPVEGHWQTVGKKGKGMLGIPVGASIGFNSFGEHLHIAPYLSYQLHFLTSYNTSIPLIPHSVVQMGTRIHLSNP